jgi:hypothetical protein
MNWVRDEYGIERRILIGNDYVSPVRPAPPPTLANVVVHVDACLDEQVEFSVTLSRNRRVTKAIEA